MSIHMEIKFASKYKVHLTNKYYLWLSYFQGCREGNKLKIEKRVYLCSYLLLAAADPTDKFWLFNGNHIDFLT